MDEEEDILESMLLNMRSARAQKERAFGRRGTGTRCGLDCTAFCPAPAWAPHRQQSQFGRPSLRARSNKVRPCSIERVQKALHFIMQRLIDEDASAKSRRVYPIGELGATGRGDVCSASPFRRSYVIFAVTMTKLFVSADKTNSPLVGMFGYNNICVYWDYW